MSFFVVFLKPFRQILRYYFEIGTTIFLHILMIHTDITFGAI